MVFFYGSNNYGHEDENKNALSQQHRPADSLFSVAIDGYHQSGFLESHREWTQDKIVPTMQRLHPLHEEPAHHHVVRIDDLTLDKLLQLLDEEDGKDSMITNEKDHNHIIWEPTPINIPGFQTVAEATGQLHTIDALYSGSAVPAMVHNGHDDLLLGSMEPPHNVVTSSNEEPRTYFCDFSKKDTIDQMSSNDGRFRLYQSELWNQRFQSLVAYQKQTGNCQVPLTYIQDPALVRWVKRQRYQYKLMTEGKPSAMTADRVHALENIGFVWNTQRTAWWDRFQELVEFKCIHGHCSVPSSNGKNPPLAVWVKCQRRQYKLFKRGEPCHLTPQRIQDLESIGFQWVIRSYNKKAEPYR